MVEKFHNELEKLKADVSKMAHLSITMLLESVDALKILNVEKADWVYNKKDSLAKRNIQIEDESLRLIALYQPMAKDMRTIACCLKMITDLNRIGRYGKDIAKVVKEIKSGKVEYKAEKAGIVHVSIGKVSFDSNKLSDNANSVIESILKSKPATSKGKYLKKLSISSTMGPGLTIDITSLGKGV